MQPQSQSQQQSSQSQTMLLQGASGNLSFSSNNMSEEMSKSALLNFRAKEEEIEKKKMEIKEKVQAQLGLVEVETKRLALIREELEGLTDSDPTKKDVTTVRKRVDQANKDLKHLGLACVKKEKEYKEALDVFNEKNKEKVQLITKLMELEQLVSESEKLRMKRLEELSKTIDQYAKDS